MHKLRSIVTALAISYCLASTTILCADKLRERTHVAQHNKAVSEADLEALVLDLYVQAQREGYADKLPAEFQAIHTRLMQGQPVLTSEVEQALQAFAREIDRAQRLDLPNAESAVEAIGPFGCDFTQVERILGLIRTRIGTTNDSACQQSVLGILGNACVILGPDKNISICLKEIKEILEIAAHCPIILKPGDILPKGYTITNPGYYALCGSVGFDAPATATCIIRIASSNVTLDLNQHTLYQVDIDPGLDGICIENNVRNVVVKNGKIAGLVSDGITIGNGCRNITLSNLTVRQNGGIGIDINGTSGNRNQDFVIEYVDSIGNANHGMDADFTDKVKVTSSKFNNNTGRGISATSCNVWHLTECQASANSDGALGECFGAGVASCNCWRVQDSDFSYNTGLTAGLVRGIFFDGISLPSGGHEITNCTFCGNNSASTSNVRGLQFRDTSSCVVKNCSANGNFATNAGSVEVQGFFASVLGFNASEVNMFEDCVANGNYALGTGPVEGFSVTDQKNFFIRCIAKGNSSTGGTGTGIRLASIAGDSAFNCLVQDCQAISNSHRGFHNETTASNLFIGNLSFGHGLAGNYVGTIGFVTVGSTAQPAGGSFDGRSIDNISVI